MELWGRFRIGHIRIKNGKKKSKTIFFKKNTFKETVKLTSAMNMIERWTLEANRAAPLKCSRKITGNLELNTCDG